MKPLSEIASRFICGHFSECHFYIEIQLPNFLLCVEKKWCVKFYDAINRLLIAEVATT